MIRQRSSGLALVVTLAVLIAATARSEESQRKPKAPKRDSQASEAADASVGLALEPGAIDILKAMSTRLAAAKTMSFTAVSTYESPSRLGPPLVYATVAEVTLKRPDKLRVITPGDGPPSEFYYDGKTMMAYEPAANLVAVAEAPPTIDAALRAAYESAAIYFPFNDVVVADPYQDLAPTLKRAFYIGQSRAFGGTMTDMVGILTDQLFGQLWIGAEDKLPRVFRAVYLDDPSRLRQQVEFLNWRLDGEIPANAFASVKAASARRIAFARPDPKPPAGADDAVKGQPSKSSKKAKKRSAP